MGVPFTAHVLLTTTADAIPPAGEAVRVAVRVFLGALIAVLLTYIVIEQIGFWRRRRGDRDR